ncbi:helix-turn-helix transcriptional regulator [Microbacterium sp. NC79]|uniref:response regulator transcription factor n=1 Tax=Microbacterium sp. NC79 TaxID=2851009 RepID=UPI001C2BC0A6|nr:LuxR C-terminal-related transcriptional regulator [Microbacterium sp. NC79]
MEQPDEAVRDDAMKPLSVTQQENERDVHARRYIATIIGFLDAGDVAGAEHALRTIAFSELLTNANELHAAFRQLSLAVPIGTLATPERPALLLAIAFARREATGHLDALVPLLVAAAAGLRKQSAIAPEERARDLSLAALCLHLAQQTRECIEVTRRAADLVRGFTFTQDDGAAAVVGVAATDLAISFFLNDRVAEAASMWQWVREHTVDPRVPRLMQADWGTSVVGVLIGDRSLVSPLAASTLEMPLTPEEVVATPRDPWWLMVATARAWTAIDRGDIAVALTLTQRMVSASPTPMIPGPLGLVHCAALIFNDRASSALVFVDEQLTLLSAHGAANTAPRLAAIGIVAASIAGDRALQTRFADMISEYPGPRNLALAMAAMVTSDERATVSEPSQYSEDVFGPRWRALYWTIFAAIHAHHGNRAMAMEGLRNLLPLIERHHLGAWLRLIPQPALDTLHVTVAASDLSFIADLLPARATITVVPYIEFTAREEEILRYIGQGFTNAQIAAELYISPNTVKFHVAKLLKRLGVSSRDEAATLGAALLRRRVGRIGKSGFTTPKY